MQRVESEVPQVMWNNISKLKKFPWVKKAQVLRKYTDEAMNQRKIVRFVSDWTLDGQKFITYFNTLYEEEYKKHTAKNVRYISKRLKEMRRKEKADKIQE